MKNRMAVVLCLLACGGGVTSSQASSSPAPEEGRIAADEAAVAQALKALHDPDASVRAKGAHHLRSIVARYPSGTTDLRRQDAGRAFWQAKLTRIEPGMKEAHALRLLGNPEVKGTLGSGQSHITGYQLDDHWTVDITYRNPDTVLLAPQLKRSERLTYLPTPEKYSGTWTLYFVNGQKAYDISYQNGVYEGPFTSYHDNGKVAVQQHFRSGNAFGADRGWYADGKPMYRGQHRNGRPDGEWVHWYPNGQTQRTAHYKLGRNDGVETFWHENGQMSFVRHYKAGVLDGEEAAWSSEGVLQYRHVYVNGQVRHDVSPAPNHAKAGGNGGVSLPLAGGA